MANEKKVKIVDWAGNDVYPGKEFNSNEEAWDFLTEEQHKLHEEAEGDEFDEIMGEFDLKLVE